MQMFHVKSIFVTKLRYMSYIKDVSGIVDIWIKRRSASYRGRVYLVEGCYPRIALTLMLLVDIFANTK